MKKLRSHRGDTLMETLVALLIVVMTMGFLATAIVTAARVNAGVRDTDTAVHYRDDAQAAEKAMTVTQQSGTGTGGSVSKRVYVYEAENGYRYYTYKE